MATTSSLPGRPWLWNSSASWSVKVGRLPLDFFAISTLYSAADRADAGDVSGTAGASSRERRRDAVRPRTVARAIERLPPGALMRCGGNGALAELDS